MKQRRRLVYFLCLASYLPVMGLLSADINGYQELRELPEQAKEALFVAIENHDPLSSVKELCFLVADINARSDYGVTLLIDAVAANNQIVVKYLLEQGADVNAKQPEGEDALIIAAGLGYLDLVIVLVNHGADIRAKNGVGLSALNVAIMNHHADVALWLIEHGADVNDADNEDITPLMNAAKYGHVAVAQKLIEYGAAVNAKREHGETALLFAAKSGYTEIVELLLTNGAHINDANNSGITPLMLAAGKGYVDIVKLFIANNVALDLVDFKQGFTAFMFAAVNGHKIICDLLLKAGADYTIVNYSGTTALELAELNGKHEVVAFIEEFENAVRALLETVAGKTFVDQINGRAQQEL